MRDWPPITEPELVERLRLDLDGWADLMLRFGTALGQREHEPAHLDRALGYPWQRPERSYVLRDGAVTLVDDLDPGERRATIAAFTGEDRHPLLAFGSNAAPGQLRLKVAHLEERDVLVLAGHLHGYDVGAGAAPTAYGSMPGALFASPGTAVRAAVLWVTAEQATQLTWSELGYVLGRLDEGRFEMDEADVAVEELFAYVHRIGAYCIDDEPVALAAVPARDRTARAVTQRQLLDGVAPLLLGDGADAGALVRAVFDDMAAVFARSREVLWPRSRRLPAGSWTPF